jgi:hypothetical protein
MDTKANTRELVKPQGLIIWITCSDNSYTIKAFHTDTGLDTRGPLTATNQNDATFRLSDNATISRVEVWEGDVVVATFDNIVPSNGWVALPPQAGIIAVISPLARTVIIADDPVGPFNPMEGL